MKRKPAHLRSGPSPERGRRGKRLGRQPREQLLTLADFPRENPHPLLRLGRGGDLLYANDSASVLIEEEKRRTGELLPQEVLAAARAALGSGEAKEAQGECAGGRIFSFYCVPFPGKGYVNIYGREVTEAVRVQEALRNSNRHLRLLSEERETLLYDFERRAAELDATLSAIAAPLIIYDPQGRIVRLNPAAEKLLAYTPEMCAKPLAERIVGLRMETPEGTPLSLEHSPFGRAFQGETVVGEILKVHRPPNRSLWGSVSAAPIRTSEGEINGVVATFIDITPLQDLQREREMVVHTISHDLRTPLTVIMGHAQLLPALYGEEGAKLHIEAILTGAERMNRMIEDLVEAARLEGGKIKLEKEPIQLHRFVADFLQRSATALDLARIAAEVPPDLPLVEADPSRLERILTNLLTNALKFSPDGSPVEVRAKPDRKAVVVSVLDRGRGIASDDLPHIFDRFYRPKGSRQAGSVGLGLFITRQLVEAHGGAIGAESAPGKGSEFYFTLPTSRRAGERG